MADADTRVDFYVHDSRSFESLALTACRLADKAWQLAPGRRIVIRVEEPAQAAALDELLWTFRDRAFIPHTVLYPQTGAGDAPVLICEAGITAPASHRDLLINLAGTHDEDAAAFGRVAELVDADETRRKAGRARFRRWRELGISPRTHQVATGSVM